MNWLKAPHPYLYYPLVGLDCRNYLHLDPWYLRRHRYRRYAALVYRPRTLRYAADPEALLNAGYLGAAWFALATGLIYGFARRNPHTLQTIFLIIVIHKAAAIGVTLKIYDKLTDEMVGMLAASGIITLLCLLALIHINLRVKAKKSA